MAIWPFRRRVPALPPAPEPATAATASSPEARRDGFIDWNAGHGTDRDPRLGMYFIPDLLSEEQEIALVRGSWLGRRIVGDIVDEAFRPGWCLEIGESDKARDANGDEIGEDKEFAETRKRNVKAAWKRLKVMQHLRTAFKWERAHGGAAILLGLDDKQSKPDQRARDTAKLRWLRVLRSRDLTPARYYSNPFDDKFGEVELWQLVPSSRNGVSGPAPLMLIHESRLLIFGGIRVTDDVQANQLPGFGDGVLPMVVAGLRRFASSLDGMELTARRNGEPWWKIDDLPALLALDKGAGFTARLQAKELARSTLKTNVINRTDEIGTTAAPLTGYREVFEILKDDLAAAAQEPKTILFGDVAGGIGDGSAGPREDWHATAAAWAGDHAIPALEAITLILMREDGGEPVDWSIDLAPQRVASEKETAEIVKLDAETDVALVQAGVVTAREAATREAWRKRYGLAEQLATLDLGDVPDDIRDPGGEIDPASAGAGAPMPPGGEPVQATALNGAQVAALLGIVKSVALGEVPRESGIEAIAVAFPTVSREQATRLVGPEGFKPAPPPAAAVPPLPDKAKPEEPAP